MHLMIKPGGLGRDRPLLDSYYDSPAPRRSQENGPAIVSPRAGGT